MQEGQYWSHLIQGVVYFHVALKRGWTHEEKCTADRSSVSFQAAESKTPRNTLRGVSI
jgi:hypothetical protein